MLAKNFYAEKYPKHDELGDVILLKITWGIGPSILTDLGNDISLLNWSSH